MNVETIDAAIGAVLVGAHVPGVHASRHGRGDERRDEHKIDAGANGQHNQKIERAVDELLCATDGHGFIIDDAPQVGYVAIYKD